MAGSGDAEGALDVNEEEVLDMLLRRDQAREKRDFGVADGILDELLGMGISLDDARRQRVWWVGRRADGKVNFRGAAAAPKRREWYTGGDAKGGDGGGGKGKGRRSRRLARQRQVRQCVVSSATHLPVYPTSSGASTHTHLAVDDRPDASSTPRSPKRGTRVAYRHSYTCERGGKWCAGLRQLYTEL